MERRIELNKEVFEEIKSLLKKRNVDTKDLEEFFLTKYPKIKAQEKKPLKLKIK